MSQSNISMSQSNIRLGASQILYLSCLLFLFLVFVGCRFVCLSDCLFLVKRFFFLSLCVD